MKKHLKKNKSAIYIVPEISLTPQTIQRVINRFGKKKIAIIHSQMTGGQRLAFWQQIRNGKINIVIGSRSAIFAPLPNLGIIVIDEEHDLISFKSDQTPRYELHPVAEKMAEISGAKLILGTATPLAETWQKARDKQYELLELPERISTTTGEIRPRPMIKIIDSGREVLAKNYSPISLYLESALEEIVKYGRKALIFINRRGAATLIICSTCGWISKCPSCDIPFVYHLSKNKSVCHHCGKIAPPAAICPICSGLAIKYLGTGTQKIEAEIARMFPKTKILRLDRDITSKTAHKEIFDEFKKDESAILIGTQMIAHGWDIPEVDLVGILGADLMLNFPDFRAQEKTFELLVQLAGRAGRGSRPGIVVIQTNQPESAVYENVKKYEIEKFLDEELEARREHGYPPFTRLIKLSFGHKLEEKSKKEAVTLFNNLQRAIPQEAQQSLELLGPMPALLYRLHGRYWWQIIIKCHSGLPGIDSGRGQNDGTKQILDLVPNDWIIDIDPISLV